MQYPENKSLLELAQLENFYLILQLKDHQFVRQIYFNTSSSLYKVVFIYHPNLEIKNVICKEATSLDDGLLLLNDSIVANDHHQLYPDDWVYNKVCYVHTEIYTLMISKIKTLSTLYPSHTDVFKKLLNQVDFYAKYFSSANNLLFIKKLESMAKRGFLMPHQEIDVNQFHVVAISANNWGSNKCVYHDSKSNLYYTRSQYGDSDSTEIDIKLRTNLAEALNFEGDEETFPFYFDDWGYVNPQYNTLFEEYYNSSKLHQNADMMLRIKFWQQVFAGLQQ